MITMWAQSAIACPLTLLIGIILGVALTVIVASFIVAHWRDGGD